jgi:Icc protein
LHELTDYSHVTVSAGQVVIHQCSFLYDGPLLSLQDRAALEWIGR